ncbi:hypothetical protein OJAV_G00015720 [Oryzias javanicus]|uniref:C-type lectin domain-containing protein n=1 Tax=Oryzias javanicus TaxID=123683 RepID=A0A3S2QA48_ORYJA|nr:hypothetical protein OJAV_G00015720 [Oryzias javanicus]
MERMSLRMLKLTLLFLTLSGLQAVPIAAPGQKPSTNHKHIPEHIHKVPANVPAQKNGGGWGTEPFMFGHHGPRQETQPTNKIVACKGKVIDGKCFESNPSPMNFYEERANQQQAKHLSKRDVVTDHSRQGPVKTPTQKNGGHKVCTEESPSACLHGYRQGSEPLMPIQDGVRQNTEPRITIRDGFRQGTERFMPIRDGFRQGTERFMAIKDGFRQGTERFMAIKDGFRQGTERFMAIKDGFRQGTERFLPIHDDFQQGTESFKSFQYGFRQGTEPDRKKMICKGGAIHGICYVFNPTLLTFNDAQNVCKDLAPNAKLVTVNSSYLHKRLVSLVTGGGKNKPVATWLGGTIKNQKASWEDGSEWKYSRWMPGYPNIHTDKPLCVEMFKKGLSSWTTADCHQTRASICSYPMTA